MKKFNHFAVAFAVVAGALAFALITNGQEKSGSCGRS